MGSKLYTRGERIFKWVSLVLLLVICVATLAPFVLILASSLTDETTLITYGYSFWPQKFSMDSYLYMWNQRKQIGRSYLTSLGITAVGTVVSLLFTTMLAYPMSRKDFKYSNQLSFFVFFTMLFNGGIVSSYIMWTQIFHIKNKILFFHHSTSFTYCCFGSSTSRSPSPKKLIASTNTEITTPGTAHSHQ